VIEPGEVPPPAQAAPQQAPAQAPQQAPAQTAPVTPQAAAPAPQPPPSQPAPSRPAAQPVAESEPPDPRPQIEQLVAAYAQAIENKSIGEMRRVYPGLRADQEAGWRALFRAARGSVTAELAVTHVEVSGNTAAVDVSGRYVYDVGGGNRTDAVNFRATAGLEGGAWRFKVVP
jgi:hypothetical protein